jgi:hypothetical protein
MRRALAVATAIVFQAGIVRAWAGEPLVGTWRLERQELNGEKANSEPLTLKVSQAGDRLAFAFSVPVNQVYFVSMSYTLRLDGTQADIKDSEGNKIGTIQMTVSGTSQYKLVMKGPNRADSFGKLTVSPDGKTLTSEADTVQSGRPIHSKQLFSRY